MSTEICQEATLRKRKLIQNIDNILAAQLPLQKTKLTRIIKPRKNQISKNIVDQY